MGAETLVQTATDRSCACLNKGSPHTTARLTLCSPLFVKLSPPLVSWRWKDQYVTFCHALLHLILPLGSPSPPINAFAVPCFSLTFLTLPPSCLPPSSSVAIVTSPSSTAHISLLCLHMAIEFWFFFSFFSVSPWN